MPLSPVSTVPSVPSQPAWEHSVLACRLDIAKGRRCERTGYGPVRARMARGAFGGEIRAATLTNSCGMYMRHEELHVQNARPERLLLGTRITGKNRNGSSFLCIWGCCIWRVWGSVGICWDYGCLLR